MVQIHGDSYHFKGGSKSTGLPAGKRGGVEPEVTNSHKARHVMDASLCPRDPVKASEAIHPGFLKKAQEAK